MGRSGSEPPRGIEHSARDAAPDDARVVAGLREHGVAIVPDYVPAPVWKRLAADARHRQRAGGFRSAGVGRGAGWRLRPEIRCDAVRWIEPASARAGERAWLERMEALRRTLNRDLYLGLLGFESHFALYPPGAFYRTHLDAFRDASHRVVSVLLYLNEDWRVEHGGALRLHLEKADAPARRDVLPEGGTLVGFLAAELPHEVLPATRERWSVAGWFTRRD